MKPNNEALLLITEELQSVRDLLEEIAEASAEIAQNTKETHIAVGAFHGEIREREGGQEASIERLRERVAKVEGAVDALTGDSSG